MRPKKHENDGCERSVPGQARSDHHMKHELVQLAGKLDWECSDGRDCAPLQRQGPARDQDPLRDRASAGSSTFFALSDEEVCERWVYDPYFQYFTGEEFFQHARTNAPT